MRAMGPLSGFRILEFAGIGPGPFCAMMLADMGAEIIRVDRTAGSARTIAVDATLDVVARGRKSIALDLKNPQAIEVALRLCRGADALIEGFRPGVMERLGLGPDACSAANPALVYGRMTGWGQTGPMAQLAGHDINYLALSGDLHMFGRAEERPGAPLNLVADMGGGGMMLAFGITCALLERQRSGRGQVIDAAMFEGAATLASSIWSQMAMGWWKPERGANLLDSGAPFYEVYETSDGRHVAIGAIEPQFYRLLLQGLGLDPAALPAQMDRGSWPAMKQRFADIFRRQTRAHWERVFEGSDACFAPVLTPQEAVTHPHAVARGSFTRTRGLLHPAPAPRFSRSGTARLSDPPHIGQHTRQVLGEFGFEAAEIGALLECGAVRQQADGGAVG